MSVSPAIKTTTALPTITSHLEKVRSNLLEESGVTAGLPIMSGMQVEHLISDYLGPDRAQEEDVSRTFSRSFSERRSFDLFNKLLTKSQVFQRIVEASGNEMNFSKRQMISNAFIDNVKRAIQTDPALASQSIMDAQTDDVAYLSLLSTLIKAGMVTAFEHAHEFSPKWIRDVLSALQKGQLQDHISAIYDQCKIDKEMMAKEDRLAIEQWIRKIVALQQCTAPLFEPTVFTEGTSKGYTYAIKKDNTLYGYLFGTQHTNYNGINRISVDVQKRLLECAILGTEIIINPKEYDLSDPTSVEESLVACAAQRAIATIGIDDEVRDGLVFRKHEYLQALLDEKIMERAYLTGDADKARMLIDYWETPPHPINDVVTLRRNQSMADNIDALLKGCRKIQQESRTAPIKCFFAVGAHHVLYSNSVQKSIVDLLKQKGWTIELLP